MSISGIVNSADSIHEILLEYCGSMRCTNRDRGWVALTQNRRKYLNFIDGKINNGIFLASTLRVAGKVKRFVNILLDFTISL